ncbi:hypothetical protein ACP275_07G069900 [Erythranthe tilingii]
MDPQENDPIISSDVDERSFDRYWSVAASAEEHVNETNAQGKSPSYAEPRPPPPWSEYKIANSSPLPPWPEYKIANSSPFYEPCFPDNELVVTVKVITPQGNFDGVAKMIPEEEAICRLCFNVYNDNMFQTKCKCKFAMIHRSCEVEWTKKKGHKKCDVCEQDIQNIPIIISRGHSPQLKRGSTPKRFWSKYICFRL